MTNELKLTEYIKYQQLNSNYQSNGIELCYAWDYSIEEKFYDLALTENLSIGDKFKAVTQTGAISGGFFDQATMNYSFEWWLKAFALNNISIELCNYSELSLIPESQNRIVNGKKYSLDSFRFASYLHEISKNTNLYSEQKFCAVEIGSGNGHLASTFKKYYRNSTYVMVDIPIIGYFAACNLISEFPELNHLFIRDSSHFNSINILDYDFIYLPSYLIPEIKLCEFSICLSTHALGEMTNNTLSCFFNYIDRCNTKYIFSVNRFCHNAIHSYLFNFFIPFRKKENSGSMSFPKDYKINSFKHKPWFLQNPYTDSQHPQYLFVILERSVSNSDMSELHTFLDRIKKQEWYKLYGREPIGINLHFDPDIPSNIDSIMCEFWNLYRLGWHSNKEFLECFSKFLRYYCRGFLPEEYYLIKEKFYLLTGSHLKDSYLINKFIYYLIYFRSGMMNKLRKIKTNLFKKYKQQKN